MAAGFTVTDERWREKKRRGRYIDKKRDKIRSYLENSMKRTSDPSFHIVQSNMD